MLRLGPAAFEPVHGRLVRLGELAVDGPRLDVWRAPIDNDRLGRDPVADRWRAAGLHRMTHRLDELDHPRRRTGGGHPGRRGRRPTWRCGPSTGGARATTRSGSPSTVTPLGDWDVPLPRVGVRMVLPGHLADVAWFGLGPGEAYADSRSGVHVDRYAATVDELQTPYVYPQENGNRSAVRWVSLTGPDGTGLRIEGRPTVEFTARRWSSEDLDRAGHADDLVPSDRLFVNVDAAQHGLGSAACGPGPAPEHVLTARETELSFVLRAATTGSRR